MFYQLLFVFAYTSQVAYGAVIYFRVWDEIQNLFSFLINRAHAAPIKQISINCTLSSLRSICCQPTIHKNQKISFWDVTALPYSAVLQLLNCFSTCGDNYVHELQEKAITENWKLIRINLTLSTI